MSAQNPNFTVSKKAAPSTDDSHLNEVDHTSHVSSDIGRLFNNSDYADMRLIVGSSVFPVHKIVLASRSQYFRALFFNGLSESELSEIELKDINEKSFQHLLQYIYTGRLNLHDIKDDALDLLGLAHQFNFVQLETSLSEYLQASLTVENIARVYDLSTAYNLSSLCQACLEFWDRNAAQLIGCCEPVVGCQQQRLDAGFLSLSLPALTQLLSRDSFFADECQIFNAARAWCEARRESLQEAELARVFACIRLELISLQDLLGVVRPSQQISPDALLDAIQEKSTRKDCELRYRGVLLPNENVATRRHGAEVTKGECGVVLLDGDTTNYDSDRGFARHPIDDKNACIAVKLGQPSIINTVRLLLWDKDSRCYSYYVEVSTNECDWVVVCDHSGYLCRSWQELRFAARVVRHIRIVGTHNSVNRVFHCVALEASYSRRPCRLVDGLLAPEENVATVARSACVIEGVSRLRNALINGDTKNYDWESGYTCHQLGNGAIVVQLPQPYLIGSLRMLLWDLDSRAYGYTVDVSCDQCSWQRVCDTGDRQCRSWQVVEFTARPVVFVRIVGTSNTANEVFHVVHFECPCQPAALREWRAQEMAGRAEAAADKEEMHAQWQTARPEAQAEQ